MFITFGPTFRPKLIHQLDRSPASNSDVLSNEDPATRTFHRTTSALLTLEDANAILGSILQNSISAEKFSDNFSSSNIGQISKQQILLYLPTTYGH
jgi:hypothetical protein